MNVEALLERLERVKQTGPGRWLARCPAHPDRRPSLSVRELDDGRVLIHCFGGCEVGAVLDAVGLTVADLLPDHAPEHRCRPTSSKIPPRDLLAVISEEVSVITIVAADLLENRTVSEKDWKRLAQAAARIGAARDHVYAR
jgi:hypothetical protein